MKTKARNINTNNIVSETKQRAPYQDDELVELQEVLEVNPDVINESLADVDGGGEEIDASLLKQLDLVELDEDECILMNMKEKISDLFWCRKHVSAKFDEPTTSWLKVSVDLRDRWFGEFKKEYRWHPQEERAIKVDLHDKWFWMNIGSKEFQRPPTAWEVMEKTKKLKSGEWVNDKSREFASIIPAPSLSPTIADGTEHHANDAQVDRPYDMGNNH
ncbi:hypothetical protein JHK87_031668 [Glycine soja]|nr:hypothetical protein JHK87_031668 [Glycine soja]